jgi:hypothetical protein
MPDQQKPDPKTGVSREQLIRELRGIARSCFKPTAPGAQTCTEAANLLDHYASVVERLTSDGAAEAGKAALLADDGDSVRDSSRRVILAALQYAQSLL